MLSRKIGGPLRSFPSLHSAFFILLDPSLPSYWDWDISPSLSSGCSSQFLPSPVPLPPHHFPCSFSHPLSAYPRNSFQFNRFLASPCPCSMTSQRKDKVSPWHTCKRNVPRPESSRPSCFNFLSFCLYYSHYMNTSRLSCLKLTLLWMKGSLLSCTGNEQRARSISLFSDRNYRPNFCMEWLLQLPLQISDEHSHGQSRWDVLATHSPRVNGREE